MAIDWGTVITGVAGQYINARYGQSGFTPGIYSKMPSVQPAYFGENLVDTVTGAIIGKRRRRRRRLLTPTDLSDLAALKTVTGNSEALKFAVIKAVRR